MLTRRTVALLCLGALAGLTGSAQGAEGADAGVRRPDRITVGVGDQYLGAIARDGHTLYFVSNRNTTNELIRQDIDDGHVELLFDEGADVTWPRVSPDGRALLYISFRDRAAGQLCVRDLPRAEGRRCLEGESTALQAEWIDADRILLVSRASIPGNLDVLEVTVGRQLAGRPLLERNLISPAVSPDGRWLVYVPVERLTPQVGPAFAAHAALHLEAVRLDHLGPPSAIQLDLPGFAGQPTFAPDGRYLYFVQFMSDSNHDGVIDANDHGVVFRVPFPADRDDAPALVAAAEPEQLTPATWNCQYPSPSAGRLILTCSRGPNLDVYTLPPDGVLPADWTADRLALEIELASSPAERTILYRRRLAMEGDEAGSARLSTLLSLVQLHLQLEEFAPVEFYARRIGALPGQTAPGLSEPLLVLAEHREALRDRERGRTVAGFHEASARRLALLRPGSGDPAPVAALKHVVRSEVADSLGEKGLARAELSAVAFDDTSPPALLSLYYEQADSLYRELDDREALVDVGRRLSNSGSLTLDERRRYALAAVRAMRRGRPLAEADSVLAAERQSALDDSELAFALDLARAVLAIRAKNPPAEATEALMALYRRQTRPDRKRAVVFEGVQRGTELDADELVEALAQEYLRDVKPGTMERRQAERLYQRTMIGRAYRRAAKGQLAEARADFDAVTRETGSLETVVASIELQLRSGDSPATIAARFEPRDPTGLTALDHFAKAYLLARTLPRLDGKEHAKTAAAASAELRASWKDLKKDYVAQALFGAIMHEEYLRSGSLPAAERANSHLLVALDLVHNDPRYRAMLLGQLGLLHTEVGNYRIALRYLEDREKLPFVENGSGLAVRLSRARALLHVERETEAATAADEALEMIADSKNLAVYQVLALDRAALYNLAATRFQRALDLYDAEIPLLEAAQGSTAARNSMVAHLGRAAAALGAGRPRRALKDLEVVDAALKNPALTATLRWPHASAEHVLRSYRLIASGLRANVDLKLGQLDAASLALSDRRDLFVAQLALSDRLEHARDLTLTEARLAENAAERKDLDDAAKWVGRALDHADSLVGGAHGEVDPDQLAVLWLAAELGARAHAPISFDLSARLSETNAKISEKRDPVWRNYERSFEIYLTLLARPNSH